MRTIKTHIIYYQLIFLLGIINFFASDFQPVSIRVLLNSTTFLQNKTEKKIFCLESNTPFLLKTKGKIKKTNQNIHTLYLIATPNTLYVQEPGKPPKKIAGPALLISSTNQRIKIDQKEYAGALQFIFSRNKLFTINHLDLEEYVYSVIRFEIFQSWPLEMQKVQAVASRTFALYHMLKARKQNKLYDIKSSSATHQQYGGWHPYIHVKEAVSQTKGLVLAHNNSVALAMFDICCGGIVPSDIKTIHEYKAPYLARKNRCVYCSNYRFHSWEKTFSPHEIIARLKRPSRLASRIATIGSLKEIAVREKDKAGVVHKLILRGTKKSIECPGEEFLEHLKNDIKSLCFTVENKNNSIHINGKGFGHQLGICQRGAYELVKKGWNFKKILQFYYPHTSFTSLKQVYHV